jgi:Leucine-rich repeat (LRR) protein
MPYPGVQAWQRTGPKDYDAYGNYLGQRIDLSGTSLQYQLLSLPTLEANFDHVTRLRLNRSGFSNPVEGFLGHFRQLRALNLSSNQLTRLPAALVDMPHLLELHLSNKRIMLTGPAIESIKNLTRLKILGMENNPLALPPDVSRMPDLHILNLSNYIQGANRRTFNNLRRRIDAVLDLQVAQEQWTQTADLSARTLLREKITTLAALLGKQPSDVPPGRVMTDEEYVAELVLINTEKNNLLKKLTREAMDRAKLQRVEIPVTEQSDNS